MSGQHKGRKWRPEPPALSEDEDSEATDELQGGSSECNSDVDVASTIEQEVQDSEHGNTEDEQDLVDEHRTKRIRKETFVTRVVKESPTSTLKYFVNESIIHQIPIYSAKLSKARAKAAKVGDRLRIVDTKFRKDEPMTQAIEYLTTRSLPPLNLNPSDPYEAINFLCANILFYELSLMLQIKTLERAIAANIEAACGSGLDTQIFLRFARACYETVKIPMKGLLGSWIKRYLSDHLYELVEGGVHEEINEIGGSLNTQLVEVFAENFKAKAAAMPGMSVLGNKVKSEKLGG